MIFDPATDFAVFQRQLFKEVTEIVLREEYNDHEIFSRNCRYNCVLIPKTHVLK